jgi:hypothetical protein
VRQSIYICGIGEDGLTNGWVMRHGVDSFLPSSWKPQEEGMMNIAARFSLSKKPRFVDQERKKPIRLKVMLDSLVTLQQGRRL